MAVEGARVTVLRGCGSERLAQALREGIVSGELREEMGCVVERNEALEREIRLERGMRGRQEARLGEYRKMCAEALDRKRRRKIARITDRDIRSALFIGGFTLGATLAAMVFTGTMVAGWFG